MMDRGLINYEPRLISVLHSQLPHHVISENGLKGSTNDGHQAEATVQHLIIKLLTPHLPCPDLIRNNKKAFDDPKLGACIPDVIIDCIGGSPWGYFELKTLLTDDELTSKAVEHDLQKLRAYKNTCPAAAAVFVLVGTRKKLSDRYARTAWEKSGLSVSESAFNTYKLRPQVLDSNYIAIPCGSSGDANEVVTLTWEVQPAGKLIVQSGRYRFLARMADT